MSVGNRPQDYGTRDRRNMDASLEAIRAKMEHSAQEDVMIEHPRRLFMRSANGTWWQITVSDEGALTVSEPALPPT